MIREHTIQEQVHRACRVLKITIVLVENLQPTLVTQMELTPAQIKAYHQKNQLLHQCAIKPIWFTMQRTGTELRLAIMKNLPVTTLQTARTRSLLLAMPDTITIPPLPKQTA